jgi:hypothetical protein
MLHPAFETKPSGKWKNGLLFSSPQLTVYFIFLYLWGRISDKSIAAGDN